jgi:aerobic carbon-monoxide dehydrogenase medium subunit
MHEFNYHRPSRLDEATKLRQQKADALYLAGGQTLIPTLKQALTTPSDLVDLAELADLRGVDVRKDRITIGAMTRHADVAASQVIRQAIPALCDLAAQIGDAQVRNCGTLGGSLANSDPAADYPAAVIALDAVIHTDRRQIAAKDYFVDLFETALEPGELIVRVEFPIPKRAAYRKMPNPASRYAMVGVMVAQFGNEVRVGVTGAGPCAFRASVLERALAERLAPDALDSVTVDHSNFNSDLHASAEYRGHLVKVMAKRAVADLLAR